jgi:formylglycine-generating enzyme required for sulfatase activity
MKKRYGMFVMPVMVGIFFCFLLPTVSAAADKVVVIPLGGAPGNAVAADVVKGKTFSSRAAGKGVTGTLKIRDGSTIYTNSIGMEFSLIPAGSFVMGSPAGTGDDTHYPYWPEELGRVSSEKQHIVILSKPFFMQTTEVTQGEWELVMGAGTNPSHFSACGMDCPVEMVSWYDTQNFIDALNAREGRTSCNTSLNSCYSLPTEAQWEYAARAGTVTAFYSGAISIEIGNDPNLDKIGWYGYNPNINYFSTHPVAQKEPNVWGLYDMSGNVWEWCQDRFDIYPDGPVTDPLGAVSGTSHIIRGGGWGSPPMYARSASRVGEAPQFPDRNYGFRVILPGSQ